MTAQTKTTAKTTTKTTAKTAADKAAETVSETDNVSKIADSARDYVQRAAAAAMERSDSAYENVNEFNKGVETTLNRVAAGYVSILGGIARANHENVKHALSTVEKVAAAKSFTEAAQVQVDFVREAAAANYDNMRAAYDTARDVVTENAEAARARAGDIWPFGKKAA